MTTYLFNCFLLLLPVIVWNIAFTKQLPKGYRSKEIWDAIPSWLSVAENVLRAVVFLLPLFMKLAADSKTQEIGIIIYSAGLLVYFASWLWQMYFPTSIWSKSIFGYMAPAYTILVPLVGIGMIGERSFIEFPQIRLVYIILSIAFVTVHTYHSYLAFKKSDVL